MKGTDATPVFSGNLRRFLAPGQRVTLEDLWQPGSPVEAADVEFLTYARVVGKGRLRSSLEFPLLFGAVLRRMALPMYAHCGGGTFPLPTGHPIDALAVLRYFYDRTSQVPEDRQAIRDAFGRAEQVGITANRLRWEDWERYSTRQEDHMRLGGVVGTIRYTGPLDPFLPYLRLGEYIHVGKNTAFGLGQMAVRIS